MKHPLIIGAGGVASYLLPCLLKAFKLERVTVIDKDVLEERNLDRQLFSYTDVGKYKASALVERLIKDGTNGAVIDVIIDWFTGVTQLPEGVDAIICVADNHEARRNAIQLAYEHDIRCYIGGNEYFDAEAYVTWRDHEGTKKDPRVRYPKVATSNEGSPLRCQGEAQEIYPQLAIANQRCSGMLLHLLFVWETTYEEATRAEREELVELLPIELASSLATMTAINARNL